MITVANASASDDLDFPVPASSGTSSSTGQPLEPDPVLSGTPGSTPDPLPSGTPGSPADPSPSATTPPPGQSGLPDPWQSGTMPPPEPGRTTTPPSQQDDPANPPSPTYSGPANYYKAEMGACGQNVRNTDFVVALDSTMFGTGYPSPSCGRKVVVTYHGKSVTATVLDESPVSRRHGIDLTRAAFEALAPLDQGTINVTWRFAE
ncbi:RlpA-like double-psi beta-barrel domain-containing protein [Streptomyces sp. NPDC059118]|uniref:RlpA-like double-psi beta-barrel domain-containing protein n=1 Tax=unclassified Streptomyces TaxID=2593676 RepID=UPI00367FBEB2